MWGGRNGRHGGCRAELKKVIIYYNSFFVEVCALFTNKRYY